MSEQHLILFLEAHPLLRPHFVRPFVPVPWTVLNHNRQKGLSCAFPDELSAQTRASFASPANVFIQMDYFDFTPPSSWRVYSSSNVGSVAAPLATQSHPKDGLLFGQKEFLAVFVGRQTHPVRAALWAACRRDPDIIVINGNYPIGADVMSGYRQTLAKSVFALAPRGNGVQSFRFYEAFEFGAVPVYIYDDSQPWVPYASLPWDDIAVFIPLRDIAFIRPILLSFSPAQVAEMVLTGRKLYSRFFSLPGTAIRLMRSFLDDSSDSNGSPSSIGAVGALRRLTSSVSTLSLLQLSSLFELARHVSVVSPLLSCYCSLVSRLSDKRAQVGTAWNVAASACGFNWTAGEQACSDASAALLARGLSPLSLSQAQCVESFAVQKGPKMCITSQRARTAAQSILFASTAQAFAKAYGCDLVSVDVAIRKLHPEKRLIGRWIFWKNVTGPLVATPPLPLELLEAVEFMAPVHVCGGGSCSLAKVFELGSRCLEQIAYVDDLDQLVDELLSSDKDLLARYAKEHLQQYRLNALAMGGALEYLDDGDDLLIFFETKQAVAYGATSGDPADCSKFIDNLAHTVPNQLMSRDCWHGKLPSDVLDLIKTNFQPHLGHIVSDSMDSCVLLRSLSYRCEFVSLSSQDDGRLVLEMGLRTRSFYFAGCGEAQSISAMRSLLGLPSHSLT